jgi:predicted XRE-type DNA-binding protein
MTRDAQSKQNDMEVRLASQRLRTTNAHRIKRDMHQADVDPFDISVAQPRCTEVAGQKLQKPEVGRDEIVNLLLALRQCFLVCCSELLLAVERIFMSSRC